MSRWFRETALPGLSRHVVPITLCLASALIFYWLWPEIWMASLGYNDAVSHYAMIRGMDETWRNGGHITDFWMANINFGHAIFRSYQFLMHLVVWVMHKTVFSAMDIPRAWNTCIVLVAMAMPWTFYKGWRWLGLNRIEALAAAVAVVMIHEKEGYGIGLTNATFSGYGTVNQLFATVLFPLAAGQIHRMIRDGRHVISASILYACVFMSHILTGYFLCLWAAIDLVFALVAEKRRVKSALIPLAKFGGLCLLWTGYWFIPMAQDGLLQRKSSYESGYKWPGHGAAKMLTDYSNGSILDDGRFPVLTILAGLGLLYCLIAFARKKKTPGSNVYRLIGLQTIAWIVFSFGPSTLGALILWLPIAPQVHWHRAFGIAEIMFSLCAGVVFAAFWNWLNPPLPAKADAQLRRAAQLNIVAGLALAAAVLYPCLVERSTFFYATNIHWLKDTLEWWKAKPTNYPQAIEYANTHNEGRWYAGHPWNYGNDIKISSTIQFYALLVQYNIENVGSIHHHQSHGETFAYSTDWRNPLHNELMNTRYMALKTTEPPLSGWKEVFKTSSSVIYDNGNLSGYFAVGTTTVASCADNDSLERAIKYFLKSPLLERHVYPRIELAKECTVPPMLEATIVEAEKQAVNTTIPGRVVESGRRPGPNSSIHWAKVKMDAPGIALFKMNYHPGWKALVNGQPAPTHMALPSFIAIPLEKGEWTIEMGYEVLPLKRALFWLSVVGGLAVAAFYLRERRAKSSAS